MLEKIRSNYVFKDIFACLNEKRKLMLIKNNQKFKEKIEINLINYRLLSGRFIEYESKIKGKEYDSINDSLIFEGEYLNGERNGKGKEYNKDGYKIFSFKF